MYQVSEEYKKLINEEVGRQPHSMIIVDDVAYHSDTIKTTPQIIHQAESFIGGFPAKKCKFEIYNFDNTIDLHGKEVAVFRGLVLDEGTTTEPIIEWVPMGVFTATDDNIQVDDSGLVVSFDGMDRSVSFDVPYSTQLDWEEETWTGLDIISELCDSLKVPLETTDFEFASYVFSKKPNFPNPSSAREVISRMAELGGEIAYISREGGLVFSKPTPTGVTITRKKYEKLSNKIEVFGAINQISLGHKDYEDAMLEPFEVENPITWRIDDNAYVDLIREEMITDVAKRIIGMSITPFELVGCVDDFLFDINDIVTIEAKDGTLFDTTILEIESTSRIKSTLRASVQSLEPIAVDLAGSKAQMINQVRFEVDHNLNEIRGTVRETQDAVDASTELVSQLRLSVNNLTTSFEIKGGNNLIPNSMGQFGLEDTFEVSGHLTYAGENVNLRNTTFSSMYFGGINNIIERIGAVPLVVNTTYSLTFKYSNTQGNRLLVEIDYGDGWISVLDTSDESSLSESVVVFNAINNFKYRVTNSYVDNTRGGFITDLTCVTGDTRQDWQPAAGELYGGGVLINYQGITVNSTVSNIITQINNAGFSILDRNNLARSIVEINNQLVKLTNTTVDGDFKIVNLTFQKQIINGNELYLIF